MRGIPGSVTHYLSRVLCHGNEMLHRLALRVLPSLTLAVTEPLVRKRKRVVMLVPGLVAFAIYRVVKLAYPLADPLALLLLSGLCCAMTSAAVYRVSRQASFPSIWREDGPRRVCWIIGWVGFVYGVQLSLLVIAMLRVLVHYDFLDHPDGPAMMAIIISCTSVARDVFEIGHIRSLERQGKPVFTFPDGSPLRALVVEQPFLTGRWFVAGAAACMLGSLGLVSVGPLGGTEIAQLFAATLIGGSLGLAAYLAGQRPGQWWSLFQQARWSELFTFWWWPGLAFAATYYFVIVGLVVFVLRLESVNGLALSLMSGTVGGFLALYCYYLGFRRSEEDRVQQAVPTSLLRCPFITGILSKRQTASGEGALQTLGGPPGVAVGSSAKKG